MQYQVAFNEDAKRARIISMEASAPEGFRLIGNFEATTVSPNPTDASTQHIHNMLYRAGVAEPASIQIDHEPVTDIVERQDTASTALGVSEELAKVSTPKTAELAVGDSVDLVDGSTKGLTFDVSDDGIVKLDKRNGKVTGLAEGTATVTVTNEKEGTADEVVITVRSAAPASGEDAGNQS